MASQPASSSRARLQGRVIGISVGAALGGFLFGFDSSVINGAVDSVQGAFGPSKAVTGFAVASALLIGSLGMTASLGTMAVAFANASVDADGAATLSGVWGPIALVAANAFVVSFGATWGPVVWVLLGEMFPNKIRATALAVTAAAQWLANWTITVSFPTLAGMGLQFPYALYTAMALLSFVFVYLRVEETKGRELEDMHDGSRPRREAATA